MIYKEFWAEYFKYYDHLNHLPSYVELLTSICQELRPRPGSLVLDLGSGTGNLAVRLKSMGCRVVALHFCPDALARHRAKRDGSWLLLADLTRGLPFKDGTFSAVVSNNVLYTLPAEEQTKLTKELYRVLRPYGKIVLANPKAGWKPLPIYRRSISLSVEAEGWLKTAVRATKAVGPTMRLLYLNRKLAKESRYHYFQPDEQRRLLEICGFRPISQTRFVYGGQAMLDTAAK